MQKLLEIHENKKKKNMKIKKKNIKFKITSQS